MKEAFREAGTAGSEGTTAPALTLLKTGIGSKMKSRSSSSTHNSSSGSYNSKKRQHHETLSDHSGDASDGDYDDAQSQSSDSASTWAPNSPSSHDIESAYGMNGAGASSSRPGSPFSYASSSSSFASPQSARSARKGTPCISIQPTPLGSPSSSSVLALFAARTSVPAFGLSSSYPHHSSTRLPESSKRPKFAEV